MTGYEVTARLGIALNPSAHYARGFHPTGTCGAMEFLADESDTKRFHPGWAAPATFRRGAWLAKEVCIQGALHMGQEMAPAPKFLQYKRANIEPSITEIIPLEEAQCAFDPLHDQTNIGVLLKQ